MTIKLGKMVTYHHKLSLKNLHDPSITCFCETTWIIRHFITPLALDQLESGDSLWEASTINLRDKSEALYLHYYNVYVHKTYQGGDKLRSSHPYICMAPQWGGHVRSRSKWNTLYLDLQETYGYETRQDANLLWGITHLKLHDSLITWLSWRHVTMWKIYISTFTRLVAAIPEC